MKTWMFYVTSLVLVVGMGIIIYHNHPSITPQLLSVRKEYALIADEDKTLDVHLYVNVSDHPIIHPESHVSASLSNLDGTKRMDVMLQDIKKGQRESYLEMIWTEWIFIYEISVMGYDYVIADCYLEITLESGDPYQIELGKLYITHLEDTQEVLEWNDLSAKKQSGSFLSRISEIEIGYLELNTPIHKISVGTGTPCTFEVMDDHIKVYVPHDFYLLSRVPILIEYEDGSRQIIQNFTYIIDHHILKESGMLVRTYALH